MKRIYLPGLTLAILAAISADLRGDEKPKPAAEPVSEGHALELKALESLHKIRSGRVVFDVKSIKQPPNMPEHQALNHTFTVEFDFDKKKNRTEYVTKRWGKIYTKIDDGKQFLSAAGKQQRLEDPTERIQILDHALALAGPSSSSFGYLDVRLLGIYSMPVFVLVNGETALGDILARRDRQEETVVDEVLNGKPVKHISYRNIHGAWVEKWIAPRMDYAVVKASAVGRENTGQRTTQAGYQQWGNFWFPVTFSNQYFLNGQLQEEEQATVTFVEFNTPVPAERFQLISLDISPDERVYKNGIPHIWKDDQLVNETDLLREQAGLGTVPIDDSDETNGVSDKTTFWYVGAILFACLGFWALARQLRKKSAPAIP